MYYGYINVGGKNAILSKLDCLEIYINIYYKFKIKKSFVNTIQKLI